MKKIKLIILISGMLISLGIHAQKRKINGIFVWDMTEYLAITKDSFKLYLYPTESLLYGLNQGDTILAEGKVQYESDNFIKLTSKDYQSIAEKRVSFFELYDETRKDSLYFQFNFPYEKDFRIILYLGEKYSSTYVYEFQNQKNIVIPMIPDSLKFFRFEILNQTLPQRSIIKCNYLKVNSFKSSLYNFKDEKMNVVIINIPDITNSYFNRFLIDGEYIKVGEKKKKLLWHNEEYWKFGG